MKLLIHKWLHHKWRPNREVYETFNPLNQKISVVLAKMERNDMATPSSPRKNDAPMGNDLNQYNRFHRYKVHSTDDCKILKKYIESLIQQGYLKNFLAFRDRSRSPQMSRQASPRKGHEQTRANKGTLNVISGGFASGGEMSGAHEVYTSQISGAYLAGNRPTEEGK